MPRGRPRKSLAKRGKSGRISKEKKEDDRYAVAETRVRRFGVTKTQSINPLAGYLAGVMFLRGKLQAFHLGHFFSYLQMIPNTSKSIPIKERVQGGRFYFSSPGCAAYYLLARHLGRQDMDVLRALANDRLECTVKHLRKVLKKIPMSTSGYNFALWCEKFR